MRQKLDFLTVYFFSVLLFSFAAHFFWAAIYGKAVILFYLSLFFGLTSRKIDTQFFCFATQIQSSDLTGIEQI